MSGTQDGVLAAKNLTENLQQNQSGIDKLPSQEENGQKPEDKLSPSQKMDRLLRGTSSVQMKKEIEKLRKEAAKYRNFSRSEALQRIAIQKKSEEIQKELDSLKTTNENLKIMRALDKAGCIKSELAAKEIPHDCEDLDAFIEKYKEENNFLFSTPSKNIGSKFKASGKKILTPAQKMDAYIRAALGR